MVDFTWKRMINKKDNSKLESLQYQSLKILAFIVTIICSYIVSTEDQLGRLEDGSGWATHAAENG